MPETDGPTGHASKPGGRRTSRGVRVADSVATVVITGGGLAVLAAMLGICVFLVQSAMPLVEPGQVISTEQTDIRQAWVDPSGESGRPKVIDVRLDRGLATLIDDGGGMELVDLATGTPLDYATPLAAGSIPAAVTSDPVTGDVTYGLTDGSFVTVGVALETALIAEDRVPESLREMERGQVRALVPGEIAGDPSAIRLTDAGDWEVLTLQAEPIAEADLGVSEPLVAVDRQGPSERARVLAAVTSDGRLVHAQVRTSRGIGGGPGRTRVAAVDVGLDLDEDTELPTWVWAESSGDSVVVAWPDGMAKRYLRQGGRRDASLVFAEGLDLGGAVTSFRPAAGGSSALVGYADGSLAAWSLVDAAGSLTPDREQLIERLRMTTAGTGPISVIAPSGRDRTVAVAHGSGDVELVNTTSGKVIGSFNAGASPLAAGLAGDLSRSAALVRTEEGDGLSWAAIEPGHPEASVRALFAPVHYEGYERPRFVYQSTGSAGSEPKLSLVPLIWGTLKATIVSMIVAVPLAVAAAIYTSEFMGAGTRQTVKPVIELMASLPSVVLGFFAAMVVAPWIRDVLPGALLWAIVSPLALVAAAELWRAVPDRLRRRAGAIGRLSLAAVTLVAAAGLSGLVGPAVERALFSPSHADQLVAAGAVVPAEHGEIPAWYEPGQEVDAEDRRALRRRGLYESGGEVVRPDLSAEVSGTAPASVRGWLDGEFGGAWPGWLAVLAPVVSIVVLLADGRLLGWLWLRFKSPAPVVLAGGLLRASVLVVMTGAGAAVVAFGLTAFGLDPRASVLGPFSVRNTLVVGFVMGFAVIPIIYTISEDALRSVPGSLRAASLGAGATPWQTAVRVILPVAGSGVFSACMVGLGRAVGETMIVLMATGNTPEMTANIFGGLRTLAANVAVELPEAPRGGTHYRVLFLCGLTLFVMTLAVNTTAELVRQQFRKRSAAL